MSDDEDLDWTRSESFREKLQISNDAQGSNHGGFGRCIYCFTTEDEDLFTKEHIIPRSLDANFIIQKACCPKCQKAIDPADRHIGRTVFGPHRIHSGARTRNKGERPTKLPADFEREGRRFTAVLPITEHPYTVALPAWGSAKFFQGGPRSSTFPSVSIHSYHSSPHNIDAILSGLGASHVIRPEGLPEGFRIELFARSIAKIAYCHAIVMYGLEVFSNSRITDVILGYDPTVPFFVGGIPDTPSPPFQQALHFVGMHEVDLPNKDVRLLVGTIRLFAGSGTPDVGTPFYHVVIGTIPKSAWTRPELQIGPA